MRRYKHVHREGCSDLLDPERMTIPAALDMTDALLDVATRYGLIEDGEGMDELRPLLKPCAVRLLLKAGVR